MDRKQIQCQGISSFIRINASAFALISLWEMGVLINFRSNVSNFDCLMPCCKKKKKKKKSFHLDFG